MGDTQERFRLFAVRADANNQLVVDLDVVDLRLASQMVCVGRTKLNQLCRDGLLDRRHIGRKSVVTVASIKEFLARLPH